jgi:NAD(P)-dependent dehydrogenase (short-subunit alcohol dehydrogenase family)
MERQVWLITGASSGLGLSTVKELLKNGYKVSATTRSKARLLERIGAHDESRLLALEVDLKKDDEIKAAVELTISHFGQLDVVMNNAAYGQRGSVEELTRQQIIDQFELNVLAVHSVYRHVLPHFRSRRNGHFLTISSTVAFVPSMGLGIYGASKAALTAMTEALAQEVDEFGIKVTSVEPGPFDTEFNAQAQWCDEIISDYKTVHDRLNSMRYTTERRVGDPEKAAVLFLELANHPSPPRRIFIGKPALALANGKIESLQREIEEWKDRAGATDYS